MSDLWARLCQAGKSRLSVAGIFSRLQQRGEECKNKAEVFEPHKKVGLPLGTGSPEKARSIASVVFTPARGVIHPASLSEAGGNDLRKTVSKPLPPRSPPFTYRHVKTRLLTGMLHVRRHCNRQKIWTKPLLILYLVQAAGSPHFPGLTLRIVMERFRGNRQFSILSRVLGP